MGLLNNLFGNKNNSGSKTQNELPWVKLTSVEQLDKIVKKSASKTQLIYKHSTTCGISRMVLNMFTSGYGFSENQFDLYFLDLHSYREVSNETGYKFQVMHQSPQLLVIKNGVSVANASHGAIAEMDLNQFV